jgi:hypothetical protein
LLAAGLLLIGLTGNGRWWARLRLAGVGLSVLTVVLGIVVRELV